MNNLQRSPSEAERTIAAWIAARDPDMDPPAIVARPIADPGRAVLMGDACHAVVRSWRRAARWRSRTRRFSAAPSRSLPILMGFASYAAIRIPRVADVQRVSIDNTWMHGPADTDWFFG